MALHRKTVTILVFMLYHEIFAELISGNKHVCYQEYKNNGHKGGWCNSALTLCDDGLPDNISVQVVPNSLTNNSCSCNNITPSYSSYNVSRLPELCKGINICNMTLFIVPYASLENFGILTLIYTCNDSDKNAEADTSIFTSTSSQATTLTSTLTSPTSTTALTSVASTSMPVTEGSTTPTRTSQFPTDSDEPYTAAIVVSVVVPVPIVVVIIAVLMYRRGQCKILLGKCTNIYGKHSPDRADAYAVSFTANADLSYDLSRVIDVKACDVDYCDIDTVGKETSADYNHIDLKNMQAEQDPIYNHICHLNSSPGLTEDNYNHACEESFENTNLSTLQPDTYSHIGALAKPASVQLAEDSYAHINGVMKPFHAAKDLNPDDRAVFQSNGGLTENSGHR